MAATMSTRQLAAVQSMASMKSVPVAPIARVHSTRSTAVVDRIAIATPSSSVEVSRLPCIQLTHGKQSLYAYVSV
jgi:hypothetical protein